ncbi:menaquinone-dependent protoporphyrinogen oxidase [Neorhodopirellula lusitana]|uniref:Menaquinone-dependent protoporphyrinogen oxidase n=1 Tax=Neorhodopirellula lusitana TaxID=445327 RepID=A0ABY1PT73_9BACT|nr:flavodoxin domain-containing protein [Neorhodopirellula lusitana]SMP42841.1 menaquinone-dependent protoporphyrinogen oxidase [Neorhodopirellula lusitana]
MRAIVIYATCEGQTERIAKRIAKVMTDQGVPTDTFDVTRRHVHELAVDSYDAVVLGSSLHYAEHDPRIAWCIRENRRLLRELPTAFFSVSLGIISEHYKDRVEAEWLAESFLRDEDFVPSRHACFAGALRYSKYGWLKKHLMQWIAEKAGNKTNTDCDYEFTDWNAVEAFAEEFANFVHRCRKETRPGLKPIEVRKPYRECVVRSTECSATSPGCTCDPESPTGESEECSGDSATCDGKCCQTLASE